MIVEHFFQTQSADGVRSSPPDRPVIYTLSKKIAII